MRAGPLSNAKVIELLNRYFVPVTSANELRDDERVRIYHAFHAKGLGIGDVHVYVVGPDGNPIGGLDIGSAMDSAKEIAFLNSVIVQLGTEGGSPIFPPHPQSAPPVVESGAPAIHLVSRRPEHGAWAEFPSENWIVLAKPEWDQLLPPEGIQAKGSWQIPAPIATKLAEWIYPQTEETKRTNRSRVDIADFRLTMVTMNSSLARARIDGKTRIRHSFYPGKPSEDFASSELLGFVDFNMEARRVQRLRMFARKADYNGAPFSCSLASVSRETIEAQR
jgi:hypothetical protein